MTALVIVMIVIQAALLWVAVAILNQLRRACELLECPPKSAVIPKATFGYPYALPQAAAFYPYASPRPLGSSFSAIWCWRGGSWELESGSVPLGFEPGPPPKYQGSFVGQRVKSQCTRR